MLNETLKQLQEIKRKRTLSVNQKDFHLIRKITITVSEKVFKQLKNQSKKLNCSINDIIKEFVETRIHNFINNKNQEIK